MEYIKIPDLQLRHVYKLHSRNLATGVWTGTGFIGIREKFDSKYLFTEYHWDNGPPYGTVRSQEDLGKLWDDRIQLIESYPQILCKYCGDPEDQHSEICRKFYGTYRIYAPLFNALNFEEYGVEK